MTIINPLTVIGNGLTANDGTGDTLRTGAAAINANSAAIVTAINNLAASQSAGAVSYLTKADMGADLAHPDGTIALVTNDPTPANNQAWRKSGASGSGSWTATIDRIAAVLGNGAGFQQSGVGSVVRTFQDKGRETVTPEDFGAIGDGSANDTAAIQAALNASLHVVLLSPYRIDTTGLTLRSGHVLEFRGGASIKLLPYNTDTYQILRVHDITGVKVIRPVLDGSRELNSFGTGEFGMGVSIKGSTDVVIENPETIGCWGDGIYIGASDTGGQTYSKNVKITKLKAYNCRRQGISVVSVKGLRITEPTFDTISGTAPQSGIDFEPNDNTNFLEDIVVTSPKTLNCAGPGIQFALAAFVGASAKRVDIAITNHADDGSLAGMYGWGFNPASGSITGSIVVIDPVWRNNVQNAIAARGWAAAGPVLNIVRPEVVDSNTSLSASALYGAPFSLYAVSGDAGTYALGNFRIENPTLSIVNTTIPSPFVVADARAGAATPANIGFIDPLSATALATGKPLIIKGATNAVVTDRYNALPLSEAGSTTVTNTLGSAIYNITVASATVTLDTTYAAGMPDVIIKATVSGGFVYVKPYTGGNFLGSAADKQWYSRTAGSYVRIRPLGGNVWMFVEKVGDWAST